MVIHNKDSWMNLGRKLFTLDWGAYSDTCNKLVKTGSDFLLNFFVLLSKCINVSSSKIL